MRVGGLDEEFPSGAVAMKQCSHARMRLGKISSPSSLLSSPPISHLGLLFPELRGSQRAKEPRHLGQKVQPTRQRREKIVMDVGKGMMKHHHHRESKEVNDSVAAIQ